jgi:hypothetical protein
MSFDKNFSYDIPLTTLSELNKVLDEEWQGRKKYIVRKYILLRKILLRDAVDGIIGKLCLLGYHSKI